VQNQQKHRKSPELVIEFKPKEQSSSIRRRQYEKQETQPWNLLEVDS